MTNLFDPNEEYENLLNRHLAERRKLIESNSDLLSQLFSDHKTRLEKLRNERSSVVTFARQRAQEEFMEIERQHRLLSSLIINQIEEISEFMSIVSVSYPGCSVLELDEVV
ncbi:hypothetical protein [Dyadobacter sp. CY323]|uniref:hypothetical protein n=1 Tax=Dyadobacter sp. CY323 TaxID=2907302 RepID=UPI001F3C8CA0|nr:hypothetical protein [Dyadobacter sp. CY323]MCE6991890.1 hypothetical protein [Dyadobacter sp. CY323]